MSESYWVGVDPGLKGAMAIVGDDGSVVDCFDIGYEDSRLSGISNEVKGKRIPTDAVVLIEDMSCVMINSKQTEFSKGYNMGRTIAFMEMDSPYIYTIPPKTWKEAVGGSADKDLSRELAGKIPGAAQYIPRKQDHDRAEAILLAHLAWQRRFNALFWEELVQIPRQARQSRQKRRSNRPAKKGAASRRGRAWPR